AHQFRLKPALRLLERSPVAVSLTEPVTLNGPPNSFCSALSERRHLSSLLEMSAPNDTLVSVGRKLKRSAWLVAQLWACPVAFGSDRVIETPFCSVNETSSPTGTERLNVVPSLPCSCEGSRRVSIAALSQPSGASSPGAVMVAEPTTAQRGAELALLVRGIEARVDRSLVPAERRLEPGRGDGGPADAGRLIGDGAGEQLVGLERHGWNG